MSVRRREIAGAPERSASEAADLVVEMLTDTLAAAAAIDSGEVERELAQAIASIRMLIAGKHLGSAPLVLVADPLWLEITVTTGNGAAGLDEQLGRVRGAATAVEWRLHLPAPEPIHTWIADAVEDLAHVTVEPPATGRRHVAEASAQPLAIDLEALRRVAGGSR